MSLLNKMPHRCTISRLSYTDDGYGEVETETALATGVHCWLQNAKRDQVDQFAKRDEVITHTLFTPVERGWQPGDIITMTTGPELGKRIYFVADADRSAGLGKLYGAHVRVESNTQQPADTTP